MRRYIPTANEIPSGFCECGCGQVTDIVKETIIARRHFRGYPLPRRPGHPINRVPPPRNRITYGSENPLWRGGKHFVKRHGYVMVYVRWHPLAANQIYMPEHRWIITLELSRRFGRTEHVRHINGDRADNRRENLQLLDEGTHHSLHTGGLKHPPRTPEAREKYRQAALKRWHGIPS